jgi:protein ImuA
MKASKAKCELVGRDGTMGTQALVAQLRYRIERIETSARVDDGQVISSGCSAVDELLPEGGCRRGALVEWVAEHGSGADFLSLLTAANACADGGALVIADRNRQFNPPAAAAIGIDLGNVVVIRPPEEKSSHDRRYDDEFFWAIDQALGCSAVAAVWGAIDRVGERWFRRFQLSAEASGTMGLFVRPMMAIEQPTWSEVRWHVAAKGSDASAAAVQQVELKLARCRGGRSGRSVELSIDTVSGKVAQQSSVGFRPASAQKQTPSQAGGLCYTRGA